MALVLFFSLHPGNISWVKEGLQLKVGIYGGLEMTRKKENENCVASLSIPALEIMRPTRFLCPGIISPPILRSASMIGHKGTNQAARYAPANQRFLGIKPNTIILQV